MKLAWQVIALLCLIHILLAGAFAAWLVGTGRMDRERIAATVDLFRPTLSEDQQAADEAAKVARDAEEHLANVVNVTDGPTSVAQRLSEERQRHEITLRQLERTKQEVQSLRENLAQRQGLMDQQRKTLLAEKQTLEQRLKEVEDRYNGEGFKKAVGVYESLPPKQVKQMFLSLMEQSQTDEVITYLEAMQPRKAAAVLKEFKTAEEAGRAADLTQRLRERGSELTRDLEQTS